MNFDKQIKLVLRDLSAGNSKGVSTKVAETKEKSGEPNKQSNSSSFSMMIFDGGKKFNTLRSQKVRDICWQIGT